MERSRAQTKNVFAVKPRILRDALAKLGEQGPFVLVGHSYGGPVVRNSATATYPKDVVGLVLARMRHTKAYESGSAVAKTIRLDEGAKGKSIPAGGAA